MRWMDLSWLGRSERSEGERCGAKRITRCFAGLLVDDPDPGSISDQDDSVLGVLGEVDPAGTLEVEGAGHGCATGSELLVAAGKRADAVEMREYLRFQVLVSGGGGSRRQDGGKGKEDGGPAHERALHPVGWRFRNCSHRPDINVAARCVASTLAGSIGLPSVFASLD